MDNVLYELSLISAKGIIIKLVIFLLLIAIVSVSKHLTFVGKNTSKKKRIMRYIFYSLWYLAVFICTVIGYYLSVSIATTVLFVAIIVFGFAKNDGRMVLFVRCDQRDELRTQSIVYEFYSHKAILKKKKINEKSEELFFEIPPLEYKKHLENEEDIYNELLTVKSVNYAELKQIYD